MTRRPSSSIVASPVLIGATSLLVAIVAVVLAYGANQGLPFVPTTEVKVRIDNAELLQAGSEVKEGGFRLGFVERVVPVKLADGTVVAEAHLKLDAGRRLPVDSTFTVRPRSPLGLKYLEVHRGRARTAARDGHAFPAAQADATMGIDRVNEQFTGRSRADLRRTLTGAGDALAGRGVDLNAAFAELPVLLERLRPVAENLSSRETQLGRMLRELGDAARVVAPVARLQAEFFADAATTFEALSRDERALQETIARTHPALRAGTRSFRVQRPFLDDSVALARDMRPTVRDLRGALPELNDAFEVAVPVLERTPRFYRDTEPVLVSLRELAEDPATRPAVRGLVATGRTAAPQLRYIAPFQTVCNYPTYWFTYLGEHISQSTPYGFAQRALSKNAPRQKDSLASMGAAAPANGEDYDQTTRNGAPAHFQGQSYGAAINERGEADCEFGQRGYGVVNTVSPPRFQIAIDPNTPGDQGPTYAGRDAVLPGQTFTRDPETGLQRP